MKIHITGIGVISAIGKNCSENFHSLVSGKSGIKKSVFGPNSYRDEIFCGIVSSSNEEIIRENDLKNGPYSRTSLLGLQAAKEAWGNNKINPQIRTGIISATTVGGMDRTEDHYKKRVEDKPADFSFLVTHDSGNTTERIAADLGITGYVNTLSTACSSAANAIMLGARLIEQNKLDRVLVGGSDALTHFTIKGFHSLFIFDSEWVKPFDENRNGLNLGEGAGFLLLENEKSLSITKNKTRSYLSGWCNAADAYHQTASSPEGKGATIAMTQALAKARVKNSEITYVNAHGTGTKNNDLSESVALKNVFGENVPAFSSTKAFTGHTLAAAGAMEAVFSVLAIENSCVFPNLNFKTPITEVGLVPQQSFKKNVNVHSVLSNSFGFGGNNTSLVFKKI